MELLFQETRPFVKDLRALPTKDGENAVARINDVCQLLLSDRAKFSRQAHRPKILKFGQGLESSLYSIRITPKLRALVSVDEDPIFERIVITLFRVFQHAETSKVFESVAQSLYQQWNYGRKDEE